jgi:hypothetical protein
MISLIMIVLDVLTGICFSDSMLWVGCKQVKEITATSKFRYYEQFIIDTEDIVEANDVFVSTNFTKNIHFFLQLRDILRVVSEHNTLACKLLSLSRSSIRVPF